MHNLFVYGTLMVKEVSEKIIGLYATENAKLYNYKRYKIFFNNEEQLYPAIVPENGAITEGIVFRDLTMDYIDLLDQYEGDDYSRELVTIETSSAIINAWVYVWKNPHGSTLNGEWSLDNFKKNHLQSYLTSEEF